MQKKPLKQLVAKLMAGIFHPPTDNSNDVFTLANEHRTTRTTACLLLKQLRRNRQLPLTNDDTYAVLRGNYQQADYPALWLISQILGYYFGEFKESAADKWAPIGTRLYMIYKFLKWVLTSI